MEPHTDAKYLRPNWQPSEDEPFLIDQVDCYGLLGHDKIVELSTAFYTLVYNDEQQWFRDIFATSKIEDSIQNQYEFFIQRFGGPNLYSNRKGHPALRGRHAKFRVSPRAAARWLIHMDTAMQKVNITEDPARSALWQFFQHTAYFLVNAKDDPQPQQQ